MSDEHASDGRLGRKHADEGDARQGARQGRRRPQVGEDAAQDTAAGQGRGGRQTGNPAWEDDPVRDAAAQRRADDPDRERNPIESEGTPETQGTDPTRAWLGPKGEGDVSGGGPPGGDEIEEAQRLAGDTAVQEPLSDEELRAAFLEHDEELRSAPTGEDEPPEEPASP